MSNNILKINKLPLYWRLSDSHANYNIAPSKLSFNFINCPYTGLIKQKINSNLKKYLNIIYKQEYNIGYLQEINTLAVQYGTDFLYYLVKNIEKYKIKSALEIGCGGCIIMDNLQKRSLNITGIDSSPFSKKISKLKNLRVINKFYPNKNFNEKFDLIYHIDVLEHTFNPVNFLKAHHKNLNENGIIIINIPDASKSIHLGDISIAMHQHISYFNNESLKKTLNLAGFKMISISKSGYGSSLYAVARKINHFTNNMPLKKIPKIPNEHFFKKSSLSIMKMYDYLFKIISNNESLGFYVPLRALPYISALNLKYSYRFFDDTPHWHNKYFDGINVKIENFSDLVKAPVENLIICSLTFDKVIFKKIKKEKSLKIKIIKLQEIIS